MKKVCAILLAILLIFGATACNRAVTLPLPEKSMILTFCSWAGGWQTELTLSRDGTFEGVYSDMDMGITGEDYPEGTMYICHFTGKFSNIQKINDYTYTMQLETIKAEETKGKEWIEDGVRYIGSVPYGIEDGAEFRFYLPGIRAGEVELLDEFATWIPGGFDAYYQKPDSILQEYLLVNTNELYAFFYR